MLSRNGATVYGYRDRSPEQYSGNDLEEETVAGAVVFPIRFQREVQGRGFRANQNEKNTKIFKEVLPTLLHLGIEDPFDSGLFQFGDNS